MNRASRGLLIALEGVDGTGKTTNIGPAISYLKAKGLDAVKTSEPTSGKIGSLVRFILEGHDAIHPSALALLFAADRVEHGAEIVDHLSHNRIIVSDRYLLSSIAYQSYNAGSVEWLYQINKFAIRPHAVIYFRAELDTIVARRQSRGLSEQITEAPALLGGGTESGLSSIGLHSQ